MLSGQFYISTSILPGYGGKYILVSPLLLEDEVKQLKEAFSHIEKKKRQKLRITAITSG